MSHQRTIIRNAVKTALIGNTLVGNAVFTSKYTALAAETYPLILIYTPLEEAKPFANFPPTYERKLSLGISAIVEANDDMDDQLDNVASDIEKIFAKDQTFGGVTTDAVLVKSETQADAEGEQLFGAVHLEFEVSYVA